MEEAQGSPIKMVDVRITQKDCKYELFPSL